MGLTTDEQLDAHDPGMIYDLLIEQANDHETYAYVATQADIDKFCE